MKVYLAHNFLARDFLREEVKPFLGAPQRRKQYMTRMELEVKAYRRTGNAEHLYNIANYAHLEEYAPEHEKFHYDDKIESTTRRQLGV